jgi:hypothetical protein
MAMNDEGAATFATIDKSSKRMNSIDMRNKNLKQFIYFNRIATHGEFGIEACRSPESDIDATVSSLKRSGITVHVEGPERTRTGWLVPTQIKFRNAIQRESRRREVSHLKADGPLDWESIARTDAVISEHLRALAEKVRVGNP